MATSAHDDGPRDSLHFHCRACGYKWVGSADVVEPIDSAVNAWHPFAYFATCPGCGADRVKQAAWERALFKSWVTPRSPAQDEASRLAIAGHPTPDEAQRTRFNAVRHGLYARVATFFPARPGSYPHCDGCEYRIDVCGITQKACLKRAELFVRHANAFAARDPSMLMDLRADTQAAIQAMINDMVLTITLDGGPRQRIPEWTTDKDGKVILAQFVDQETGQLKQIDRLYAHPLIKPLIEYIAKNTLTLADMDMTPRVAREEEEARGFIESRQAEREQLSAFQQRQIEQQNKLLELIQRGGPPSGRVIDADEVVDG